VAWRLDLEPIIPRRSSFSTALPSTELMRLNNG
jgi:hypothetical protein